MADLIAGLVVSGIGIFSFIYGITMPYPATFTTSPGLLPMIIGVLTLLFGVMIVAAAVKAGGFAEKLKFHIDFGDAKTRRLLFVVAGIVVYLFVLIPLVGFLPASWIFLVGFTASFREVKFIVTLISSTVAVGLVWFIFFYLLKIPYLSGVFF